MPPMIQDNWQFLLVAAAIAYFFYMKQKKAKAQGAAPVAPVYIQTPAARMPGLEDQFIDYQDRREQEVKRQRAMNQLDKMVLYKETLDRIADLVPKPPEPDPK